MLHHVELTPVMIIGHGSSGTSILSRLLREYFGISFGTESQFIIRYRNRLHRYGDLSDPHNLRRLVSHLLSERWFERVRNNFGFSTSVDEILTNVRDATYRGVLDAIFVALANHQGMKHWGDKTPEYVHHLPVLGELFPEAKFIHLVRDGRDVALSMFNTYWGPKNVYMAAQKWNRAELLVDAFESTVPPERCCRLTYEQLLGSPVESMEGLVDFLGVEDASGRLHESIATKLPRDLKRSNFDKWRTQMSPPDRLLFERIAGETLRRRGYETSAAEVDPHFDPLRRLYWTCENKLKQWTHGKYLQDNVYKAGLRTRDLARSVRSAFLTTTKAADKVSSEPSLKT